MLPLLVLVLASGPPTAVKLGESLYVRSKNTVLRKAPSHDAPEVTVLQAGQRVVWKGPAPKKPSWHRVSVDGREGYVYGPNLSPHAPMVEVPTTEGPTADLAHAARSQVWDLHGHHRGDGARLRQADQRLRQVEAVANGVTEAELDAHAARARLEPAERR